MSRRSPKFLGFLRRFAGATGGNVAIMFAIVLVPLVFFVGAAIDYSRANMARSSMQGALDSTALMLFKDLLAGIISPSDVSTKAQAYFTALYTNKEARGVTVSASFTADNNGTGPTVQVNGTGSIATDFMAVAGFPVMNFSASSTAILGTNKVSAALVFDTKGHAAGSSKASPAAAVLARRK